MAHLPFLKGQVGQSGTAAFSQAIVIDLAGVTAGPMNLKKLVMVSLVACALPTFAEPQPTTAVDFSLYGGVVATRAMDYVTTEHVLGGGGRELFLPNGLVHDKPTYAAFSMASGVAEIYTSRRLRKNHPRLALYILLGDIVGAGIVAAHNQAIVPGRR